MEDVILVDSHDQEVGTEEKLKAHQEGKLHRAFSVFIFNSRGEMLLQRRAQGKYHSAGLWSNACCSHPQPGESLEAAAHRKLKQEMGIDCSLEKAFSFTYQAKLDNGLVEHELDHVFVGTTDSIPRLHPDEADAWKWATLEDLKNDVARRPEKYTAWFKLALDRVAAHRKD